MGGFITYYKAMPFLQSVDVIAIQKITTAQHALWAAQLPALTADHPATGPGPQSTWRWHLHLHLDSPWQQADGQFSINNAIIHVD